MEVNIIVMKILTCYARGKWDAERPIKHFFVFYLSVPLFPFSFSTPFPPSVS